MEERIGHYTIISELGRGGMGVVYKAHEESLNRLVALKVLGKHLSDDDSFVARFKREAQSAAALNHPNIVQVHAISEFDGQHCFAMEFVNGKSIAELIKQIGPMDPVKAARLILQAASGLGAAHKKGIYHRDIKPANLMVDDTGLLKIADFGLALLAEGNTQLTATGMFMGTPGYLSPEQCLDEGVDQRTDIYSLGVTLYEMLTGVTPLKADSPLALLRQIIDVEPKDVGELRPEVPETLRTILKKMMAKKPVDRFQSCDELIRDLQLWLVNEGGHSSASYSGQNENWSAQNSDGQATVIAPSGRSKSDTIKVPLTGKRHKNAISALVIVVALVVVVGGSFAAWKYVVDKQASRDAGKSVSGLVSEVEHSDDSNAVEEQGYLSSNYPETAASSNDNQLDLQDFPENQEFEPLPESIDDNEIEPLQDSDYDAVLNPVQDSSETLAATVSDKQESLLPADNFQTIQDAENTDQRPLETPAESARQGLETASAGTRAEPAPVVAKVGTGVALVSVGEVLLSDSAADYVRATLSRYGVKFIDGMSVPGVADRLSSGGGDIQSLLRPRARYLVYIQADFVAERQLQFMGRWDTELQSRLNLETHDLLDGSAVGESIRSSIGYTALSVDDKVQELLRPKFSAIAGSLSD